MSDSENIFVEQDRRKAEQAAQWGLSDLDNLDQNIVIFYAGRRIRKEDITDDVEKQKVYDDIKEQYKAHRADKYLNKDVDKEAKDSNGWEDKLQEVKTIINDARTKQEQSEISLFREEVMQLKEEAKKVDERLRKLERYSEE